MDMSDSSLERPVRHYQPPSNLRGWLKDNRYLIARRLTQFGVLLMFFGTVHWGWKIAGRPLLRGNLSASELLGAVPMADPFAVLQQLFTAHLLKTEVLVGAAIMLVFYALLGGRTFCAWVCPVNVVTDLAAWLRGKLGIEGGVRLSRDTRYWILGLALALSALSGVAAFEWVSPIGMTHRAIIYGGSIALLSLAGIFLFDLLVAKHGWCGHLCPLGAFYALLGRAAVLRVRFDQHNCTHCSDCVRICPEPQVMNLKKAAEAGMITSGECTHCARCIQVCPEGSMHFDLKPLIRRHQLNSSHPARRQA
jgi:ferredoxin-type protein NapH